MTTTGTLLVVEDQEGARETLCDLLREEGYQVYGAADGPAAIDLINRLDLDLVLTDLKLPDAESERRCRADLIEGLVRAERTDPETAVVLSRILDEEENHRDRITDMLMRSDPQAGWPV